MTAGKRTTADLLIAQTWFVPERVGIRYEIEAWPAAVPFPAQAFLKRTPKTPPPAGTVVFFTRDERLYDEVVTFEGTDTPVTVSWHPAKDSHGQPIKVATAITRQSQAVAS